MKYKRYVKNSSTLFLKGGSLISRYKVSPSRVNISKIQWINTFQGIVFMGTRTYRQIFKFTLFAFKEKKKNVPTTS